MDNTSIGKRIREKRLSLGLTQDKFAVRMGYKSKAAISSVENGKENITVSRLSKLAEALECSPSYLLGLDKDDS